MTNIKKSDNTFFAASNTARGFVNYFPDIFGNDEQVYILKGGPGTGKSYFLHAVADKAEANGLYCERYLCSSDPDSLDGIRIPEKSIAIFDGTAPHSADPQLPGAKDEILDLGQFWDAGILRMNREQIAQLSEQKAQAYASSLAMLRVAGVCMEEQLALLKPFLLEEKMDKAASRFVSKRKKGSGSVLPKPIRTFGMKGERKLPVWEEKADTILSLSPLYGVEYLYLQKLVERSKEMQIDIFYAPHPILPELAEAVYFTEEKLLVCVGGTRTDKAVGTRRFLDSAGISQRGKLLRFLTAATRTMTEAALKEFDQMQKYHFSLEAIYGTAMDFRQKQKYTEAFVKRLFEQ